MICVYVRICLESVERIFTYMNTHLQINDANQIIPYILFLSHEYRRYKNSSAKA